MDDLYNLQKDQNLQAEDSKPKKDNGVTALSHYNIFVDEIGKKFPEEKINDLLLAEYFSLVNPLNATVGELRLIDNKIANTLILGMLATVVLCIFNNMIQENRNFPLLEIYIPLFIITVIAATGFDEFINIRARVKQVDSINELKIKRTGIEENIYASLNEKLLQREQNLSSQNTFELGLTLSEDSHHYILSNES